MASRAPVFPSTFSPYLTVDARLEFLGRVFVACRTVGDRCLIGMDLHVVGALVTLGAFEKTVYRLGKPIHVHFVALEAEVGLSCQWREQ
jgi:hypothetical protein